MATGVYSGISSVARKVKKLYFGVDGIAKQVKKGYVGVDGVAKLFYTSSVEALPYRYDMKGAGPYATVVGPMDITTFVRYGSDVSMAQNFVSTDQVAASKNFIYSYLDNGDTMAGRDASTGATIGTHAMAGNVWRYPAGTSEYIGFVDSQYSNDHIVKLYDPPTFSYVKSFGAQWRDYTDPKGGYHTTMFIVEDDNDQCYEYEMNGTVIRTISKKSGRYYYVDGDYTSRLKRLDGANGNLLMWKNDNVAVNKRWGVLNYDTLAAITRLRSYPAYKDYPYGAYIHMKP